MRTLLVLAVTMLALGQAIPNPGMMGTVKKFGKGTVDGANNGAKKAFDAIKKMTDDANGEEEEETATKSPLKERKDICKKKAEKGWDSLGKYHIQIFLSFFIRVLACVCLI